MEQLLAAVQLLRKDLVDIHTDFERIEVHMKDDEANYNSRLFELQLHVHILNRHLHNILNSL
jgi:hypothetical protein